MKKTASLILATLLSVSLWADDLNSEFQKVKNYLKKTYSSNQVSYRIQINKINRIINSNQSEKDKLAALKKEFPHLYNSWQKELDAAKTLGIKFSADNKTLIKCPENVSEVIIPSCVTKIGDKAFEDCDLKSVTIPNSVTTIGGCAFSACSSLTSVNIPNSVTRIGWYAFLECSNLKSVSIPRKTKYEKKSFPEGCKITVRD